MLAAHVWNAVFGGSGTDWLRARRTVRVTSSTSTELLALTSPFATPRNGSLVLEAPPPRSVSWSVSEVAVAGRIESTQQNASYVSGPPRPPTKLIVVGLRVPAHRPSGIWMLAAAV